MYILINQLGGQSVVTESGQTIVPRVWDTELSYDNKTESVYMLFITKQLGYALKHYNNLNDDWLLLPVNNFLDFYTKADELIKAGIGSYRFAPVVGFHTDSSKVISVATHNKILSFSDLLSDYNWLQDIADMHNLADYIMDDNNYSYEQSEESGKKLALEVKKLAN